MKIFVNGSVQQVDDRTNVSDVIRHMTGSEFPAGVAVALNGSVVARDAWASTALSDDDRIEVLRATAGG